MAAILLPGLMSAQVLAKADAFVKFGRITTAGCESSQRGACSLSLTPAEPESAAAGTAVKINANSFSVELVRSRLSAQDELDIAGRPLKNITPTETPVFLMLDNLVIDSDSLKNIGLDPKGNNTILAGQYPLSVSTDKVKITFTVNPAR